MKNYEAFQELWHRIGMTIAGDVDMNISEQAVREIINDVADFIDDDYHDAAWELRQIAQAQPDPLDTLSPKDRLGYEAAKAYHGPNYPTYCYITDRDLYPAARKEWNRVGASVAEFVRQQGGDK